jgi:hypothetical protein
MAWIKTLFETRAWFDLVPDQQHKLVVAGYGTFDGAAHEGNHYVMTSDYVTAGRTPDGRLAMAYMPSLRPLKIDLAQLSGAVTARWYDPSRGTFSRINGPPFRNSGQSYFLPRQQCRRRRGLGSGAGDQRSGRGARLGKMTVRD